MLKSLKIVALMLMLFNGQNIFSQITLVSAFNKTGNANITDLWEVAVATNGNIETGILKLKIVLTSGHTGQELWSSTSPVFVMSKPQQTYTYSSFNNTKAEFLSDTFKINYQQNNIIPNGDYSICIYLINPDYDTEVAFVCNNFTIKNPEAAEHKRTIFDRWGIALKGNVQVTTFNSWGSPNRPQYPHNYVQIYGSPSVTLFNVPVQLNMLLNFPDYKFNGQGSRFSVNYDYERYKAIIKKKTTDYLNSKYDVDKLTKGMQGLQNEATKYEKIITNPALLNDIKKLNSYEQLEKKLKDTLPALIGGYKNKLTNYAQDSIAHAEAKAKAELNDFPHAADSLALPADTLTNMLDSLGKSKLLDSLSSAQHQLDSLQTFINKKRAEIESLKKKKEYLDKMTQKYDEINGKLDEVKNVNAILNNPSAFDQYIKNENVLNTKEKIFSSIRTLNVGKSVTNVSEYTLYNVPINGFTVELEPAKVYTLFSTGSIENPGNFNAGGNSSRKVTTVGLGYGKKEQTHFYIYYLDGKDHDLQNPTAANINTLAGENKVLSLAGKAATKNKAFAVDFDIAGSQYTTAPNTQFIVIEGQDNGSPRQWFTNILTQRSPNINTTVGYAGKLKFTSTLFKGNTLMGLSYKRINSSYRTFGNPYLVRDIWAADYNITQSIFKRRIKIMGLVRYAVTGLKGSKNPHRYTWQGGFSISINFPRYPMLKVSYIPNYQQLDTLLIKVNTLNCNTVYNFRTGKVKHTFSANWLTQTVSSTYIDGNFKVNSFTISNTVFFKKSLNVSVLYNHNITNNIISGLTVIKSLEANCGNTFFKILIAKAGVNYNFANTQNKFGGYAEASVNIGKNLLFKLRADRNIYTSYVLDNTPLVAKPSFNEWLLRTTLNIIW